MNPNAIFLKVNYEEHKAMCYALHVHVLPFFRFYKGAEGRACSFSCTNATVSDLIPFFQFHVLDINGFDENCRFFAVYIVHSCCPTFDFYLQIKKFKDALAKHGTDSCCLGPAKGLDESELLALASIGLISRNLIPNSTKDDKMEDLVLKETAMSSKDDNAMVMA